MSYALMKSAFNTELAGGHEKMVLLALAWLAGTDCNVAASNTVIAHWCCCSERSVSRWLASLEDRGLVSSRRQGRGRRFTVNLPLPEGFDEFDAHGQIACHYCDGTGLAMEMDHVIPRSRGGSDHSSNLVPACVGCNSEKGNQTPEEWLA